MPGQLTVHFETLAQASDDLDSISNALQEHLTELDAGVRRIAESWTGDAQEAFQGYYHRWRSDSADLHRTLRTLQRTVDTAHGNYSAARAANLRMWGGR